MPRRIRLLDSPPNDTLNPAPTLLHSMQDQKILDLSGGWLYIYNRHMGKLKSVKVIDVHSIVSIDVVHTDMRVNTNRADDRIELDTTWQLVRIYTHGGVQVEVHIGEGTESFLHTQDVLQRTYARIGIAPDYLHGLTR